MWSKAMKKLKSGFVYALKCTLGGIFIVGCINVI